MNASDKPGLFLSVIQANKGIIYKVANAYCKNDNNRKDLIQEIIIQLWLSFDKYNENYQLTTWIYRIALNVSISFYRKENSRNKISQPLPHGIIYLRDDDRPAETEKNLAQLHLFIKELKEMDRAIIILYLEGRSQQEMAEILGLTSTNIATKIARVKQQLKQKFSTLKN